MGLVSVVGGFTGLRLPETLHYPLPQTLEEGEEFGKDWSIDECFRCVPIRPATSHASYENLDSLIANSSDTMFEMKNNPDSVTEKTPLELARIRRQSMKRLVRQASVMDTQKSSDGAMQLTYWF